MKILSIDVGMKNLAYCLFDLNIDDKTFRIVDWNVIDLCNQINIICMGKMKKGGNCKKKSSLFKNEDYYCKTHAKDRKFKIPSKELYIKKIKKYNFKKIKNIIETYKISIHGKKKADCLESIYLDLSNNYFNTVDFVNTNDFNLIDYGINLKKEFEKKNWGELDLVLVENQIGPLALRMKTLQGMIMQHFIEKNITNVKEISPSNKLKEFLGNKKTTYAERKREGIRITDDIIFKTIDINSWLNHFRNHKKKDDLADSFLQGYWYLKKYDYLK